MVWWMGNISDAFARIENGEAFLYNADIQPYERASHDVPTAKRVRKLLLHRREIDRLYAQVREKGFTLVPTRLYFKDGRVKAEIAVARGKELRDKRRDVADRDAKRQIERALGYPKLRTRVTRAVTQEVIEVLHRPDVKYMLEEHYAAG